MKKGSAIVMTVITAAYFILFVLSALILISESYAYVHVLNDMDGVYYVCEAGMERASSIVVKEMSCNINATNINIGNIKSGDTASMKILLDNISIPYFSGFKSGSINQYQNYTGGNGKEYDNGSDTRLFSTFIGVSSYYDILSINLKKTVLSYSGGIYSYDLIFDLSAEARVKNAYRGINAKYAASFKLNEWYGLKDTIGSNKCFTVQESNLKTLSWQD